MKKILPIILIFSAIEVIYAYYLRFDTVPPSASQQEKNLPKPMNDQVNQYRYQTLPNQNVSYKFCEQYLQKPLDIENWKKEKYQQLKTQLLTAAIKFEDTLAMDYLYHHLGIPIYRGRILTNTIKYNKMLPKFYQGNARLSSSSQHRIIDKILSNSITPGEDLFRLIENHTIDVNRFYPTTDGLMFLFSYVLQTSNTLDNLQLETLILSGLPIEYSDVFYAFSKGLDDSIIQLMLQHTNVDIYEAQEYVGYRTSVAFEAIKAGKLNIAKDLLRNKSEATLNSLQKNAYDLFAALEIKTDTERAISFISHLNNLGIVPTKKKSIALLNDKYADHIDLLPSSFALIQQDISINTIKNVEKFTLEIYQKLLESVVTIEKNSLDNHECFNLLGNVLIKLVTKRTKKPKKEKTIFLRQPASTVEDFLIEELIANNYDILTAEEKLSESPGIQGKHQVNRYREKIIELQIQEFNSQVNALASSEAAQKTQIDAYQIIQLAKSGQWKSAIELLENYEFEERSLYSALLVLAIEVDAELSIIKQLLNNGAELMENAIIPLVKKNNIEIIRYLIDYGLDLNYRDPLGYSPLMLAIKSDHYHTFDLLIRRGADVNNPENTFGYDALDIALLNYKNATGLLYVDKLIQYGATVNLSHIDVVRDIKSRNFDAYTRIISRHPQLKGEP